MIPRLLCGSLLAVGLVTSASAAPAPRLVAPKRLHELGERAPGGRFKLTFPIRNTGDAPLQITRVRLTCGCLDARYPSQLAPGAAGDVVILFDSSGRRGRVQKHVDIESTDPRAPSLTLTISGTFRRAIEVKPGEDVVLPLAAGSPAVQVLTLQSSGAPFRVKGVRGGSPTTRFRVLPREEIAQRIPGTTTGIQMVEVTFPPERTGAAFDETVTIDTDLRTRPRVAVRFSGVPRDAVTAIPPRLYFGSLAGKGGEPVERVISLFRRDRPTRVLSIDAIPGLQTRVESEAGGRLCELHVTYRGGWKPGLVEGVMTVRTDDPLRPIVRIPYSAEVSAEPERASGEAVVRKG